MTTFARRGAAWSTPVFVLIASGIAAQAQVVPDVRVDWEVANRFRLFRHQSDFDDQVRAALANNGSFKSIFDAERTLSDAANARGWAAPLLSRLCYDPAKGRILDKCDRDGVTESYLNSKTQRVKLSVRLSPAFAGATCSWTIGSGTAAKTLDASCASAIEQRIQNATPTPVRVVARNPAGQTAENTAVIDIRDLLIVGMGDSIASGEGNPVVPIDLSDQGFCFRRLLTGAKFYLPGRAGFGGQPYPLREQYLLATGPDRPRHRQ